MHPHRLSVPLFLAEVLPLGALSSQSALDLHRHVASDRIRLDCFGAPAGDVVLFLVGGAIARSEPLPGIRLGVADPLVLSFGVADGDGRAVWSIPCAPAALAGTFALQAVSLDPIAPSVTELGISNVLQLVLGARSAAQAFGDDVFDEINRARAQHGLGALARATELDLLAMRHADYVEDVGALVHQGRWGTMAQQLVGSPFAWAGEALGWHPIADAAGFVQMMMQQPSVADYLLDRRGWPYFAHPSVTLPTHVGLGTDGIYSAILFGRRR